MEFAEVWPALITPKAFNSPEFIAHNINTSYSALVNRPRVIFHFQPTGMFEYRGEAFGLPFFGSNVAASLVNDSNDRLMADFNHTLAVKRQSDNFVWEKQIFFFLYFDSSDGIILDVGSHTACFNLHCILTFVCVQ